MNLNQAKSIVANPQYAVAQKVIADFEAVEAEEVKEPEVAAEATEAELAETNEVEDEVDTIGADDVGKVEDIL